MFQIKLYVLHVSTSGLSVRENFPCLSRPSNSPAIRSWSPLDAKYKYLSRLDDFKMSIAGEEVVCSCSNHTGILVLCMHGYYSHICIYLYVDVNFVFCSALHQAPFSKNVYLYTFIYLYLCTCMGKCTCICVHYLSLQDSEYNISTHC